MIRRSKRASLTGALNDAALCSSPSLHVNEAMHGTITTISLHDDLVILTTTLNVEFVETLTTLNSSETLCFVLRIVVAEEVSTADAILLEVEHECLTEHLSPQFHVVSDLLASVSGGTVVSEGGSHGVLR
jgi:hypothetical protein